MSAPLKRLLLFAAFLALAIIRPPAPAHAQLEFGTDRMGGDIGCRYPVPTPEICQSMCDREPRCRSFTWVKPGYVRPQPTCCLKFVIPPPTPSDCCISGVKGGPRPPQPPGPCPPGLYWQPRVGQCVP